MSNDTLIGILFFVTVFFVAPVLVVWRLSRRPVGGDVPMKLTLRGMVAGVAGGSIGATISCFIFPPQAYDALGYIYTLLFTPIVGIVFALILGAVQRRAPGLKLFGRVAVGALLAALTVCLWVAAGDEEFFNRRNTNAVKGLVCMLMGTGVVAGILSGPLEEEET